MSPWLVFERFQPCFSLFRHWVSFLWFSLISSQWDLKFMFSQFLWVWNIDYNWFAFVICVHGVPNESRGWIWYFESQLCFLVLHASFFEGLVTWATLQQRWGFTFSTPVIFAARWVPCWWFTPWFYTCAGFEPRDLFLLLTSSLVERLER